MADSIILDYHNSLLRKSDIKLLQYPNWLNDNIISFVYEYFEFEEYAKNSSKVGFIGPDTVQFIKLGTSEDIGSCIESLGLAEQDFIFFVVNDSSTESGGGSHWSTLFYNKKAEEFKHYDSWTGSNESAARALMNAIKPHLNSCNAVFVSEKCPQQKNGCDCGMYVICVTQSLANYYLNGKPLDLEMLTPDKVKLSRTLWFEKINELGKSTK